MKKIIYLLFLLIWQLIFAHSIFASTTDGTINSTYKYAWGEKIGWINFGTTGGNVHITDTVLSGYAWSANYGWINLGPSQSGVTNNSEGNLSGYAWGQGLGWINFDNVSINSTGKFTGTATITNLGDINFDCNNCDVRTDWRPRSGRPQCNNSLDDDSDSKTDYPNDPGCSSAEDTNETDPASGGGNLLKTSSISKTDFPKISNIQIIDVSTQGVNISWITDKVASTELEYGFNNNYEQGKFQGISLTLEHKVSLTNLLPAAIYHFRVISKDKEGNTSISQDFTFNTADNIAPANINSLRAFSKDGKIILSWKNPSDADLAGIQIQRSNNAYPLSPKEGKNIYNKTGINYTDVDFTKNDYKQTFFYTLFAYDKSKNYASGAIISVTLLPSEIKPLPVKERTAEEKSAPIIPSLPAQKIIEKSPYTVLPKILPPGLIPPKIIPKSVAPKEKIKIEDISFWSGNKKLPLEIKKEKIKTVVGKTLTISLDKKKFSKKVKTIIALLENSTYLLKLETNLNEYTATISSPQVKGEYPLKIIVVYEDNSIDLIQSTVLVDPYGYIYRQEKNWFNYLKFWQKNEITEETRLANALVTLYWKNPKKLIWEKWPAKDYNQINPQITPKTGEYAFLVPPAKYYLTVSKEGYFVKISKIFEVKDQIINLNVELISDFYLWVKPFILGIFLFISIIYFLFVIKKVRKKK